MAVTNKPRITFNSRAFDTACNAAGWATDRQRAREMGIDHSVLSRLRRDEVSPSLETLAAITNRLPLTIEDLIIREEDR